VAIISKDPQAYGLEIENAPPDAWEDVIVPEPLELGLAANLSGSTLERLKELNPHLKKMSTPPNEANFVLRVPEGSRANFYRLYAQLPEANRSSSMIIHTARRGETVEQVARRYNLTAAVVQQYNSLDPSVVRLSSGQQLVLPSTMPPSSTLVAQAPPARQTGSTATRPVAPVVQPAAASSTSTTTAAAPSVAVATARSQTSQARRPAQVINSISHRVRAGDTILGLAKLYGVKPEQIKTDNKLANNDIFEGQILNIASNLPLTADT
jgi:membrane-bound lytic murein transglycosylase D